MKALRACVTAGILAATPAVAAPPAASLSPERPVWEHAVLSPERLVWEHATLFREVRAERSGYGDRSVSSCLALLNSPLIEDKLHAIVMLSAHDHASAFAALQSCLEMGSGASSEAKQGSVGIARLRCAAALALSCSPYPHARAYLRRYEDDPLPRIRLIVLHMIGNRKPHAAADITFLRRKTIDPDPRIAAEATRYLREFEA